VRVRASTFKAAIICICTSDLALIIDPVNRRAECTWHIDESESLMIQQEPTYASPVV